MSKLMLKYGGERHTYFSVTEKNVASIVYIRNVETKRCKGYADKSRCPQWNEGKCIAK
jgi:hypothetical protein